ncbi:YeiH family putative sulfate export transporter [Paracoccus methylovorus]|uniref:YeiH family putative sulfate export transporter n=1 Tax=Paracoccus methylovorus TaxID=2812658 RepID=A0ABX7JNJ6_9RHOB|nr:YeiH family protein [Paracoccus methylovorus]QRZ15836.1 YeiH family putative sulfate export transporter [Paracoccus methylovorus]
MSSTDHSPQTSSSLGVWSGAILPGLGLTFGIAVVATAAQRLSGIPALSPLVVAMVLGMALRNLFGTPEAARPGIGFTLRRVLRFAIVLLGFQLTLEQLRAVGLPGLAVISVTLAATFVFTKWAGKALGVEARLAELIAAGTSVCGASAVIATNTVTRGSDEDVAYAIACVTVFGSLSMLAMPILGGMMAMAPAHYGIWIGATIHEVAQVVGAGFQHGAESGQAATVAKLSRVMLLAPLILTLGALARRRGGKAQGSAPAPWFVLGFIAVVLLNSALPLPEALQVEVVDLTAFLLTMALAAMGLETDIRKLQAKGMRPLALGALAWLFISTLGLGLVALI